MRTILLCLLATAMTAVHAQQPAFTCGTNDPGMLEQLHGNDPDILQGMADMKAELEEITRNFSEGARSTYTIPVVFHIIHNNGVENIGDAQVHDAVRILNEDFNKMNPDWSNVRAEFLNLVSDVSIEFRLAQKDPQGNCTKGITRTVSTLTNDGTQTMKNLIQWPRNKYMNIWVAANADGSAGYTLTPVGAAFFATADGIVIQHGYVGAIGTGSASRSRALTHEVGHWINLEHTWGSSNTPAVAANCNDDDNVSDTPNTIGWLSCNLNGTTCSSLDNVENYMDYSYCSKMFTTGQRTRMIAALTSGTAQRNQLITVGNLTATGVNQPAVLCAVEFSSTERSICAGGSVTFTDDSYNAVTSRTWSFPGGEPTSSTDPSPTVVYPTAGIYPVTLQASDGANTLSATQAGYVTVFGDPGLATPLIEGFESTVALDGPDWYAVNTDGDNTYQLTSTASFSGSKSVRILNTAAMDGRIDELRSTTYDLSNATQASLTFRYAYAKRNSTSDDVLKIYVSNNCGLTWSLRKTLRGSTTLTTGGTVTGNFVPTSASQWGYGEVTNITGTYWASNFRMKFEFESDGGNNLYLDDINLDILSVGMEENSSSQGALTVLPNPATGSAHAIFNVKEAGVARVEVLDMTGRTVAVVHNGILTMGPNRIQLPVQGLVAGTYFLRLQQNGSQQVGRFVVQ